MTQDTQKKIDHLKELAPEGSTIYGSVKDVARSGMSRTIEFYTIQDNKPIYLTGLIGAVLDIKREDRGLRVKGCGMDMIFATVYDLASVLYGNGYALKHDSR